MDRWTFERLPNDGSGGRIGEPGGAESGGGDLGGRGDDGNGQHSGGNATGGSSGNEGGWSGEGGGASEPCNVDRSGMACILGTTTNTTGRSFMHDAPTTYEVTIGSYYLDRFEVSVANYAECVNDGACSAPSGATTNPARLTRCNWNEPETAHHPVNCVRWEQAHEYCAWKGLRLPTEHEWDYAVHRAARVYPWGSESVSAVNLNVAGDEWGEATSWGSDGFYGTAPVDSFPEGATPDGIHHLLGNVWELTESRFCMLTTSPCVDCPLEASCESGCNDCSSQYYVVRGGGWDDVRDFSLLFYHRGDYGDGPAGRYTDFVGFRCALSAE